MLTFLKYEQKSKVVLVPTKEIHPHPMQPRRHIDHKDLESLGQSIQENGLISPITIRKGEREFFLVTGQRRLEAFRLLGMEKIPAIIEEIDSDTANYHALVENLQRSALTFWDEGLALLEILRLQKITQSQLANILGMSQSAIANKIRILKLPEEVLYLLTENDCTQRHARALLPLWDDPKLNAIAQRVVTGQLTVQQTEDLVQSHLSPKVKRPPPIIKLKDVRLFNSTLKKAVTIMQTAGIPAQSHKEEDDTYIVYTIRIPKTFDIKEKNNNLPNSPKSLDNPL